MAELKFNFREERPRDYAPVTFRNGYMVCPAGYTLVREDENTYQCEGGGHVYKIDGQDIWIDCDGTMHLRKQDDVKEE